MTIWISCYKYHKSPERFEVHVVDPGWVDDRLFSGGGHWDGEDLEEVSSGWVARILEGAKPKPGELVEIELNPTTTWVMR